MSNYQQILRSSSIIGVASIVNILISVARAKVVALLLGPAGIGLIGLMTSLMSTAATCGSIGISTVGTRNIAEAVGKGDVSVLSSTRLALFWGILLLAVFGASVFWLLRDVFANMVLDDANLSESIGWLSLGVAMSIATGYQSALLNGLRRIGDIARVSISSALLATTLGIAAVIIWGEQGIIAYVVAGPLASFLAGQIFLARLPNTKAAKPSLMQIVKHWRSMVRLGMAFMLAGLVGTTTDLVVRIIVQNQLGVEALGNFQAAWMISVTYIGFVTRAMGADYYPRLTASIHDQALANRIVNEQIEVTLLLAGPVILAMLSFAPWVIEIFYSNRFSESVDVLRWQVVGDVLKLVAWPLGIVILAAGDGKTYFWTESLASVVFIGLTWLGLPLIGIQAVGIAFIGMFIVLLPTVYWLARRRTGFRWHAAVRNHMISLVLTTSIICLIGIWSELIAAVLGFSLTMMFSLHNLALFGDKVKLPGLIGKLSTITRITMNRIKGI